MIMNPSRMLFLTTLIIGTLITISANSWISAWIGLEINLLSFIPLMTQSTQFSTEAALKYFLIQALASTLLLYFILISYTMDSFSFLTQSFTLQILVGSTLLMKMGAAPFHFWFPGVMEGLDWGSNMIIMTWQKIGPLMLFSYLISMNLYCLTIIILSAIAGSLGGFNQTSLRKIMAYSSINHLSWMLSALILNDNFWLTYFMFYSLLSLTVVIMFYKLHLSHINQINYIQFSNPYLKLMLFLNLFSLGGLPPFLGFFPKWMIIEAMMKNGLYFILLIMVFMALITLFFYLRITYSAIMLTQMTLKWNLMFKDNKMPPFLVLLTTLSLFGLPISMILISFL